MYRTVNYNLTSIADALGLPEKERETLRELLEIYGFHLSKNEQKDK